MNATTPPMAARFRLREVLDEAEIGQSEFARLADLSFATVHRLCTNATEQVSLKTLDKILLALATRGVQLGLDDIIERDAKRKRGK